MSNIKIYCIISIVIYIKTNIQLREYNTLKKYLKLIAANLCIVITAVVLYSPGLLCLRPGDESIFRAGMSIIAALALIAAFFAVNLCLLKEPSQKPVLAEDVLDLDNAKDILREYGSSRYLKSMANTASEQLDRILKSRQRLSGILEQKFTKGTMSWDKFNHVVLSAEASALQNVVSMANRMQLFDEKEYTRLQHYREDNIPDDIQEQQLLLYQKNFDDIKSMIALNENILLKLNTLTMEVSSASNEKNTDLNDDLLKEIEKLIGETKYYQ